MKRNLHVVKHTFGAPAQLSVIGYRPEVGRGTQLLLENPEGFSRTDHYQMQNGSQDLVNSLNLVSCETDDFHGVGYSFEISAVIDARLERERRGERGFFWMAANRARTELYLLCIYVICSSNRRNIKFPGL